MYGDLRVTLNHFLTDLREGLQQGHRSDLRGDRNSPRHGHVKSPSEKMLDTTQTFRNHWNLIFKNSETYEADRLWRVKAPEACV